MRKAIEISDDDYRKVQDGRASVVMMRDAIRNGIPLELCDDAISRKDLGLTDFEIAMCDGSYKEAFIMLLDKIEKASPVTPQPKMGRWVGTDEWYHKCSECEEVSHFRWYEGYIYKWCPYCGAKMEEEG